MCIPQKILLNTATIISEVNLTAINSLQREKHRITCHYSAELQTTKESITDSKVCEGSVTRDWDIKFGPL